MTLADLSAATQILSSYYPDGNVSVEHDEIFLGGARPDELAQGDEAKLIELGFDWHEGFDSWQAFT